MRIFFLLLLSSSFLCACEKAANKPIDEKPMVDIAPQREQLQKARDLEQKMLQDAENQRKVIELQTNPK